MVSVEKMFENVEGQTSDRRMDAWVTGILIAHLGGLNNLNFKLNFFA